MNLQQLRFICEIADARLNISQAARTLHVHQPGISKQVQALEDELGFRIFERRGSRLSGITADGAKILTMAQNIMAEVRNIKAISQAASGQHTDPLVIAATHTQARYVLPDIVGRFAARYPDVRVILRHSDPARMLELVRSGGADIGVSTDEPSAMKGLVSLPCRSFAKQVIVPHGHPLLDAGQPTLASLARYPLVTYDPMFTAGRQIMAAFDRAGIEPTLSVIAIGADVIKTYVEKGLGIAVLSEASFDAERDVGLRAIPAGDLFEPSTTRIFLRSNQYLQPHQYEFIEMCGPRWTRAAVQAEMEKARHQQMD
ncbi:CysB family HTH-type transcriptional regulator [Pigmentiphaga soli]|uniref:CysB family HTH-type transcriptional regulator n=1 Tax=Pigmentiphaga soli TaxID=1007095 RepID=A0ABP8HNT5_9BURK